MKRKMFFEDLESRLLLTVPGVVDDNYAVSEDVSLVVQPKNGVLANDEGVSQAVLGEGPTHGTLIFNKNGGFGYQPASDYVGSDQFTYRSIDGAEYATVSINITADTSGIDAADDAYSVVHDKHLVIGANEGVLANDTGVKMVSLTSKPSHGRVSLNPHGGFNYNPDKNFAGVDTFTYTGLDKAGGADSATVTITVTNQTPVANNDDYTVDEDQVLEVGVQQGLLANDTDGDDDKLSIVLESNPTNGTLTVNKNGAFTYTPNANFYGTDSFSYRASDEVGLSELATVTIAVNPVNDAPVGVNDTYTTDEDTVLTVDAPGVLGNDTDIDSSTLTVVYDEANGPQHGTLVVNEDGSFTYTPDENYYGEDSFQYSVSDGELVSNLTTVSITVNSVNDAPDAVDDSYTTKDINPLIVGAPGVLGNDSDVEDTVLLVSIMSEPDRGTLVYQTDGSFAYEPERSEENYETTFTYSVVDSGGLTDQATVTITVIAAPVLRDDNYEMLEDTNLMASVSDNDKNVIGYSVIVTRMPDNGTLIGPDADGWFAYQPNQDFVGVDSFTYAVSDGDDEVGPATVTITVHADVIGAAILNDEGFKTSDQLADGDLDKAAEIVTDMTAAIMDALNATNVFVDKSISVQDLFAINNYLIGNYVDTDVDGNPLWVDGNGDITPRVLNTGNDYYYVGSWGNWHGDDANGRRQYGYTGDNIEHGYHLIQNDGGTTTLDGEPGSYTLNYAGGGGTAFWNNVVDGLLHLGNDIVTGENGALEFAGDYQDGVDYYFLNEDGDRNEKLDDVANWLTFLLSQ